MLNEINHEHHHVYIVQYNPGIFLFKKKILIFSCLRLPSFSSIEEQQTKIYEHCQYCQQQSLSFPSMTRTTTLNVVINHQTIEQLIHNSLRKLLYPIRM
jgi:hypothetical protein